MDSLVETLHLIYYLCLAHRALLLLKREGKAYSGVKGAILIFVIADAGFTL